MPSENMKVRFSYELVTEYQQVDLETERREITMDIVLKIITKRKICRSNIDSYKIK